jgi:type I restriction enzyme, R subunit
MAEYTNVEKPFLDKLRQAHWQIIDQGQGVPVNPAKLLRVICWEGRKKSELLNEAD